jgi:hypothetical protein
LNVPHGLDPPLTLRKTAPPLSGKENNELKRQLIILIPKNPEHWVSITSRLWFVSNIKNELTKK